MTGDTNQRERSESEMLVSSWKRLRVPEHAQQCVCRSDIWMITLISSFCLGHNTH